MKIIYFHGFASSGATGTAESLRRMLPEVEVISPDIPVDPSEALPFLRALCEQEQPDLIIGTSMGAMYAQQMFGFRKILVNPSFNMSTLSKVFRTGEHKFLNGRKDNAKTFKITKEIIQKQNMMERQQFKGITPFDRENTYGLSASMTLRSTAMTSSKSIIRTRNVSTANTTSTRRHFAPPSYPLLKRYLGYNESIMAQLIQ